jgi:hypothetical protein
MQTVTTRGIISWLGRRGAGRLGVGTIGASAMATGVMGTVAAETGAGMAVGQDVGKGVRKAEHTEMVKVGTDMAQHNASNGQEAAE